MAAEFTRTNPKSLITTIYAFSVILCALGGSRTLRLNSESELDDSDSLVYLWPLPSEFTFGNDTLSIDPDLSLAVAGSGGSSAIVRDAFERYRSIIFKHSTRFSKLKLWGKPVYDVSKLRIIVHSDNEELQLGTDESYSLFVVKNDDHSIIGVATIEMFYNKAHVLQFYNIVIYYGDGVGKPNCDQLAGVINTSSVGMANSVYGALRGLETFSQLCAFDYETKTVKVYKAPWHIQDKPRFEYRGLLLDTSRHYEPIDVIKQIIESMSYAKLNVLHWHIIDEESFPLEVPTYPNLWKGAYTKWERYTVEDAYEIVNFAKMRGINVMAEIDIPGHAESWGAGYPDLWPSPTCREPLDVSNNFTFDVVSGILTDMRKIFPFGLFHLGGDEVNTDCWNSTPHVKQWLQDRNMTTKEAYQYFVLRAQEIAISKNWTPVNWEETFNAFASNLNPQTVVHNWLGAGVCPKAVAKGYRCIFSNQGVWYLDHLDIPWDGVYNAEPLEGIKDASEQQLVLGGEVCIWGERVDASNVQQTIWPRAAAAAERLWSNREATSGVNTTLTALPRLQYFRCLLTRRGVPAAPVANFYARSAPVGPGSCYEQ